MELQFTLHSAGVLAPGLNSLSDWLAWCKRREPGATERPQADDIRRPPSGLQARWPSPATRERAGAHSVRAQPPEGVKETWGGPAFPCETTLLPLPLALPANERRRSTQVVRLALACAEQALAASPFGPDQLRSVFASDEGTGEVCQQMLEALATTGLVSPSLFHNAVHNAPAGYFSIATQSRQASVSVSLGAESFAAGLLCAVSETCCSGQPVLLLAYDAPLPPPMRSLLPITTATASAWIIASADAPSPAQTPLGRFALSLHPGAADRGDTPAAWLPAAWRDNSSAQAFAVLALLADASGSCELAFGAQRLCVRLMQSPAAC